MRGSVQVWILKDSLSFILVFFFLFCLKYHSFYLTGQKDSVTVSSAPSGTKRLDVGDILFGRHVALLLMWGCIWFILIKLGFSTRISTVASINTNDESPL